MAKPTSPASDSAHAKIIGPRVILPKRTPQPCESQCSALRRKCKSQDRHHGDGRSKLNKTASSVLPPGLL